MKKTLDKIRNSVDNYLKYALLFDVLIIVVLWFLNSNYSVIKLTYNTKGFNLSIIENLIGASISLAGFLLASLTIIVAIRSNIISKRPENAKTPLELFFSVKTFKAIVKVFKIAIIELVFTFILSYIILSISENLSNEFIFKSIISFIFIISLSTIRSLFVLFLLINVENE